VRSCRNPNCCQIFCQRGGPEAPSGSEQLIRDHSPAVRHHDGVNLLWLAIRARDERPDLPALPGSRCRNKPYLDQGGACGAAGPASAPGSAFPEARPAHAGPYSRRANRSRRRTRRTGRCYTGGRLPRRTIIQLAATASRALPAVASHAIGSADPRPGVHSPGLAPIEEDGDEQATAKAPTHTMLNCPVQGQRSMRSAAEQVSRWTAKHSATQQRASHLRRRTGHHRPAPSTVEASP
jgi:hypothetical protein